MTLPLPQRNTNGRWRESRNSTMVTSTVAIIISSLPLLPRDAALALGAPEEILDLPWHEFVNNLIRAVSRLESSPIELSDMLPLTSQAEVVKRETDASSYGPYVAIAHPIALLARHIHMIGTNAECVDRVYKAVAEMTVPPISFSQELKTTLLILARNLETQRLLVRALACGMSRKTYPAYLYRYEMLLAEARTIQGSMAIGVTGGKPGVVPPKNTHALVVDICRCVKGKMNRPTDKDLLLLCIELSERYKIQFNKILNSLRIMLYGGDADSSPRAWRADGTMDLLERFYGWYTIIDCQAEARQATTELN